MWHKIEQMRAEGIAPTAAVYSFAIQAHLALKDLPSAQRAFTSMLEKGACAVTPSVYARLLPAYVRSGDVGAVRSLLEGMYWLRTLSCGLLQSPLLIAVVPIAFVRSSVAVWFRATNKILNLRAKSALLPRIVHCCAREHFFDALPTYPSPRARRYGVARAGCGLAHARAPAVGVRLQGRHLWRAVGAAAPGRVCDGMHGE